MCCYGDLKKNGLIRYKWNASVCSQCGMHWCVVIGADVNLLSDSINTIQKNTETDKC
jgi:hypothetical protein